MKHARPTYGYVTAPTKLYNHANNFPHFHFPPKKVSFLEAAVVIPEYMCVCTVFF